MQPDHRFLDALTPTSTKVEPALVVDKVDSYPWDEICDVLVVGVGLAGAAATLRAAEDRSLEIIAVDRSVGGGASQLSGGIIYMGGGTKAQKEAGVEDTPDNMAKYLAFEAGDLVRPDTVQRFARASTTFQPWLESHGARFGGPATDDKTSYPLDASLYFSGNEITAAGRALAAPAQRGHRAKPPNGGEPTRLSGAYLLPPLLASIRRQPNVRFFPQTRAHRMIVDGDGEIVGVEVLRIPPGLAARQHAFLYGLADNFVLSMLKLLDRLLERTLEIEHSAAKPVRIRVRKGVVLSAGGFAFNRAMLAKTAPDYLLSMPLGTIGDDGSGIKLGMTVGAKTDLLHRVSAWKFIYAPATWTKACSIGPDGQRLFNEELYGARTGEAVFEKGGGRGWLILDQRLQNALISEIKSMKTMLFQKIQLKATLKDYTVSARTLPELARKIGVPPETLLVTVEAYNRIADGEPDPMNKARALCPKLEQGPFYATDIGPELKMSPTPALTMGGLVVDEDTGQVLGANGMPVKRLFAAGRTAVGICSNYYVSGLSLADCMWSGWRAAETLKGAGGVRSLGGDASAAVAAQ